MLLGKTAVVVHRVKRLLQTIDKRQPSRTVSRKSAHALWSLASVDRILSPSRSRALIHLSSDHLSSAFPAWVLNTNWTAAMYRWKSPVEVWMYWRFMSSDASAWRNIAA